MRFFKLIIPLLFSSYFNLKATNRSIQSYKFDCGVNIKSLLILYVYIYAFQTLFNFRSLGIDCLFIAIET